MMESESGLLISRTIGCTSNRCHPAYVPRIVGRLTVEISMALPAIRWVRLKS